MFGAVGLLADTGPLCLSVCLSCRMEPLLGRRWLHTEKKREEVASMLHGCLQNKTDAL